MSDADRDTAPQTLDEVDARLQRLRDGLQLVHTPGGRAALLDKTDRLLDARLDLADDEAAYLSCCWLLSWPGTGEPAWDQSASASAEGVGA